MIRIILRGSRQCSPDDWEVYHKTITFDSPILEKLMKEMTVIGGEIVLPEKETKCHE